MNGSMQPLIWDSKSFFVGINHYNQEVRPLLRRVNIHEFLNIWRSEKPFSNVFLSLCLSEGSPSVPPQVMVLILYKQTEVAWVKSYEFLSHSVSIILLTSSRIPSPPMTSPLTSPLHP